MAAAGGEEGPKVRFSNTSRSRNFRFHNVPAAVAVRGNVEVPTAEGPPAAGAPSFLMGAMNRRRVLSGPAFQQSPSEHAAALANYQRGVNARYKTHQTEKNKKGNLGYARYAYTPGSEHSIFGSQMLQVRRAPFAEEAHAQGLRNQEAAQNILAEAEAVEATRKAGSVPVPVGVPPLPPGWTWSLNDEDNLVYISPRGRQTYKHPRRTGGAGKRRRRGRATRRKRHH